VRVGGRAGWSSSLYGAAEGVPELLAKGLAVRFPRLLVAGTMSLPFRPLTPEEDAAVIERINAATPGLAWVGLSTPNQER
jgi:N-acetylglucosaminyldiphosphoundecaprenol N-acetyl-beta-D-mannosaminyltransferase